MFFRTYTEAQMMWFCRIFPAGLFDGLSAFSQSCGFSRSHDMIVFSIFCRSPATACLKKVKEFVQASDCHTVQD